MVKSKIVNTVNYSEHSKLNLADRGHSSCLYIVPILDKEYLIALGKQDASYADQGLVFYSIYLLNSKHKIKAKVGVYEAEVAIATSLLDDEGDVDLTQLGDPLLFSYVNSLYLDKYGTSGEDLSAKTMTHDEIIKELENDVMGDDKKDEVEVVDISPDESDEEEDDDDVFKIKKNTKPETGKDLNEQPLTYETVFTKETHMPTLPTWTAETQEEAKISRKEYKKTKNLNDNWFVKLLKNKNYILHENEGAGDCFFATIRDSFAQLGYITTVEKLRFYLAQEVDDSYFKQYQEVYKGIDTETKMLDHEMDVLQKTNVALKKQSDKTEKMEHQKDIVTEALHVKKEFNKMKNQKMEANELLGEFGFMKNIQTVDDLKSYVKTQAFWADHWTLNKMEAFLKTKFIIIEKTDDPNQMLRCTEAHIDDFDPTYYTILAYYGNRHYELVSFKDKKIFKFGEIPFDIKKLVVDKCMERATGVFNRIPAFRQFQEELGIQPQLSPDSHASIAELCDPKLVLSFHSRSDKSKKPGMVEADTIPTEKRTEFSQLSKIDSWRRRLDDSWVGDGKTLAPFTTEDGNRWSSVVHYLTALPFKESNPAIYIDFCADTDLGKDLDKALSSLSKKKAGRHFAAWNKTSKLEESIKEAYRKEALTAKFTQNLDMKELLKSTGMAKLEKYRSGTTPFVDIALMEVRASILS